MLVVSKRPPELSLPQKLNNVGEIFRGFGVVESLNFAGPEVLGHCCVNDRPSFLINHFLMLVIEMPRHCVFQKHVGEAGHQVLSLWFSILEILVAVGERTA